jgi:hypothetical protein
MTKPPDAVLTPADTKRGFRVRKMSHITRSAGERQTLAAHLMRLLDGEAVFRAVASIHVESIQMSDRGE